MKRIPIIFIILLLLPLLFIYLFNKSFCFVCFLRFIILPNGFFFTPCIFWPPQVYIVYFGEHSGGKTLNEIEDNHHSYLLSVKRNEVEDRASLIYSYRHSINGFAAMLTPVEASKLSSNKQKHHMGLFPIINLFYIYIYI